jgi:MFS family permease
MTTEQRHAPSSWMRTIYPWLIIVCGMLFYCYNYFLRVSPGVMKDQLSSAFHINAYAFGTLAGLYYWSYTPMQLPAGMIYDRFGVRFVLSAAVLTSVAGLWVFISTDSYYTAALGRLMIGAGCAFAYIGTLKLASIWLPSDRFAFVAGLTTAAGMTSGAMAQKYLTRITEYVNYHDALYSVLIVGIVLSVLVACIVRNRPNDCTYSHEPMRATVTTRQLLHDLKHIFTSRQMWLIGIIGCLVYLPSSVFLDTWGVPYLQNVYGLSQADAVNTIGFTFYGWIIAGPLVGALSDQLKLRKLPLAMTGLFAAVFLCAIFYGPHFEMSTLNFIFFMVGFCCGAHSICFALGKENNPVHLSGTAVATTNMLIMAGGMVFQPLAGALLDLHASGTLGADGLRIYTTADYNFALSVIPLGVALGIFLCIFLKETHGEYQYSASAKPDLQPAMDMDDEPELEPAK